MNTILKTSLKNIFCKPLRTLLVVFSIFVCSISGFLCFDLLSSITDVLKGYLGGVSKADFYVNTTGMDNLPDGFPEAEYMEVYGNNEIVYNKIDGEYCYVSTDTLTIFGVDLEVADKMEFISGIDVKDNEIWLSHTFAEEYEYEAGDKITLHDRADNEVELTVGGTIPEDVKNPLLQENSAIINLNTSDILCCGDKEPDMLMIDVIDDSRIEEAEDILKDAYPGISIQELTLSDSQLSVFDEIQSIFYILFAVALLLVVFVTASICNRIVSERMSFIGTLRSLGMSSTRTGLILLLENTLYALLGSIPAVALYSLIRSVALGFFFSAGVQGTVVNVTIPPLSIGMIIGVVLGAIVIECALPLRAILKALNTSVRDIIFDNRDTKYNFSKSGFIAGLVCFVLAIVLFFFRTNIIGAIGCVFASIAALALLFPVILRLVTSGIRKLADNAGSASWSLAATEAISRKSTVSSGILSVTAAAMCIVIFAIASGLTESMDKVPYVNDLTLTTTMEMKHYSYIEHLDGVEDVEALYYCTTFVSIDDSDAIAMRFIYGMPDGGFKYYTGFENMPDSIEPGNIIVGEGFAERKGYKVGDKITLTIDPEGVFPIAREYTIQALTTNTLTMDAADTFVISLKEYQAIFSDIPGEVLVKCDNPDELKGKLETYGKGTFTAVQTLQELNDSLENDNRSSNAITIAVVVIAFVMTAIGMITNQLIGFEGRKKECAVMLSTAMNKAKLASILWKEVLITSFTASGIGTLCGTLLTYVVNAGLSSSESIHINIAINPMINVLFFILLALAFSATVLFPIKNLRKMKIAEQIKYE